MERGLKSSWYGDARDPALKFPLLFDVSPAGDELQADEDAAQFGESIT
jgi:hypothetical protein